MLKHKSHLAIAHMQVSGVFTAKGNIAAVGCFQPGNDAQQRGFSAARGAQQRHQLARFNGQIDVVQRDEIAKALLDIDDVDAHTNDPVFCSVLRCANASSRCWARV